MIESSALKFESFCVEPSEKWMFAGNALGEIWTIEIDEFSVVNQIQAHSGIIQAMAAHRGLPYIASLSTDRTVGIWRHHKTGLSCVCTIPLRAIVPSNDSSYIPFVHSTSQALGFHDIEPRLVTRTGNAGMVELEFSESGTYRVRWCVRLHGDADLISIRFVKDSDQVLSGSIDGKFILSEHGKEIRHWQIGKAGVHWAEHLNGDTYLIASDMRAVARVDISDTAAIVVGEPFTRDDLEHVTYNRVSKRAYVASFDRTIYEINTETCQPIRTAYCPPFKCRWIKTLERSPSIILVQCRNGGLYKANGNAGNCLAVIKRTPDALWTAVHFLDGSLGFSGEGEFVRRLIPKGTDPTSLTVSFGVEQSVLPIRSGSYTKRMVLQGSTGRLVIGRTNGDIAVVNTQVDGTLRDCLLLGNMGSAVRDLAVAPEGPALYVACEDGHVRKLNLDTGETVLSWRSRANQPIWSLAHSPQRALIAIAERDGSMFILDDKNFREMLSGIATVRPKRMKFAGDVLLYNKRDQMYRLDLNTGQAALLVDSQGNTIEDFIWDDEQRYLILIGYMQNIVMCDFLTGEVINVVPDQIDYSKGLIWVHQTNDSRHYPLDFLTFGRSGTAHYFRVHDEKLVALGPVSKPPKATCDSA